MTKRPLFRSQQVRGLPDYLAAKGEDAKGRIYPGCEELRNDGSGILRDCQRNLHEPGMVEPRADIVEAPLEPETP